MKINTKIITIFMQIIIVMSCSSRKVQIKTSSCNINGHEYVDLALPSKLKWATCNVGASNPTAPGDYFAWGEISTKRTYMLTNYKWSKGNGNTTQTKYVTSRISGQVDSKTILEKDDDVASVKWGGNWRIPTEEEQQEMLDGCSWKLVKYYDKITHRKIIGYLGTSKRNNNEIFFPLSGMYDKSTLRYKGEEGFYWSSTLNPIYSLKSMYVSFTLFNITPYQCIERSIGGSVRPVTE